MRVNIGARKLENLCYVINRQTPNRQIWMSSPVRNRKERKEKSKGKQAAAAPKEEIVLELAHKSKSTHIPCEEQRKIDEAYKKLQDVWLSNGEKVPPVEFAKHIIFYALKILTINLLR
ncbi:hypothetical protein CASFOL_034033 [Castilleja foliolosa]|uniref:peptidylprolyl isomerase n=1 Tax=Castilleja foliolosa TaxID=1961234 RepID=A0ABD3C1A0_9LAMI